ncbi:DegV family protein [Corynebacterium sphenisci]|uniref:DegV family protein n=1 Tax=Corynebacterium sphenisci TaxID=191493 RepID=UPI0026DF5F7D|nr:DegV family protein [Corynebacterium sphenisci]MDO5730331.1 DegV family protein [Corynebacterium sphenisci]
MAGRVQVVVDDSACLPRELAAAHGITVLPLPVELDEGEPRTSAIQPLPLCAAYARAQERGGDAGVLALHLGSALSSTLANARTAAAAVGGVEVLDTAQVGAGIGVAAVAAARAAAGGGDLAAVTGAARETLARTRLWGHVPRLEAMRRGGRISAGQAVLSTALAMKPLIGLEEGQLKVAAKCRTEAKLLEALVGRCTDTAGGGAADCVIQTAGDSPMAGELAEALAERMPDGSTVRRVELPPALIAHTGPRACFVTVVCCTGVAEPVAAAAAGAPAEAAPAGEPAADRDGAPAPGGDGADAADPAADAAAGPGDAPLVTTVDGALPTWSRNRRAAKERADALARAIAELARRDRSDPEAAGWGAQAKREAAEAGRDAGGGDRGPAAPEGPGGAAADGDGR